jgi:excisionase family DNA binding protein
LIRMERVLITPAEAAEVLGISVRTVYRVIRRGDLPVVRVGRCPRIPVKAMNRWVDSQLAEFGRANEIGPK